MGDYMKNNKGFTLIELLISMMLLSFVIMMSATLFDNAIQDVPKHKQAIENTSIGSSKMETGILEIKEIYKHHLSPSTTIKPKSFDSVTGDGGVKGAPVTVNISENISVQPPSGTGKTLSVAKGYFVSVSKTAPDKLKYNKVEADDSMFTFISTGHKPTETSSVENIALTGTNRFVYFPLNAGSYNIRSEYNIANATKGNFQKLRHRFLKSSVGDTKSIFPAYFDDYEELSQYMSVLTRDMFEYTGVEKDSENLSDSATLTVDAYSSNIQNYINSIDKTFASTALTFNINGHIGEERTSFSNTIPAKQNVTHIIGLPYIQNLLGYYDHNLLVSKSITEPNKYYSLFDTNKKNLTAFGNLFDVATSRYKFSWGNFDIGNITGLETRTPSNLKMPDGFCESVRLKSIDGVEKDFPNFNKAYGNTVYYNMENRDNAIEFEPISASTVFIKYNPLNYCQKFTSDKSSQYYPHSLISNNIDLQTGLPIDPAKNAFALYVEPDGNLKMYSVISGATQNVDLGYNMNNTNLYTDSADYKFEKIGVGSEIAGKRDEREGFNILRISRGPSGLQLHVLTRDIRSGLNKIETNQKEIALINIPDIDYQSETFYFGMRVEKLFDKNTSSFIDYTGVGKPAVMEISDALVYSGIWMDKEANIIMNYLYRKYLTENERNPLSKINTGKFDEYYMNKVLK